MICFFCSWLFPALFVLLLCWDLGEKNRGGWARLYDTREQDLGSESLWNCCSRTRCTVILHSFWWKQELKLSPERGRRSSAPHSSTELHFTASWAPSQHGACTLQAENYFSSKNENHYLAVAFASLERQYGLGLHGIVSHWWHEEHLSPWACFGVQDSENTAAWRCFLMALSCCCESLVPTRCLCSPEQLPYDPRWPYK